MTNRKLLATLCTIVLACVFATPARAGEATVPDVVGLSLDQAQGLLQQAGFRSDIVRVSGTPVGVVVSQEPGGLATRDTSGAITLRVGGPTPKPGMSGPAPTQPDPMLPPAGAGTAPIQPSADAPAQPRPTQPAPGQPAPTQPAGKGSAFAFNGRAIPPGRLPGGSGSEVPSVLGQNVQQARASLRGWNVVVERTLGVQALTGKVVNQWPHAGETMPRGATLTIVVAVTERPSLEHLYVPQAERRDWREAIASVSRARLVPQPVSVPSSEAMRGKVVAQTPQPGSLSLAGHTVRLFIGRGPGAYSADVGTASPAPTQPQPAPTQPAPDQPAPDEPAPDRPTPTQPAPTDPDEMLPPAGTGAAPIQPGADAPTQPTPTQPRPTEPTPTQPDRPAPTQPESALPKPPRATLGAPSLRTPPAGESYPYKYGADFSWTAVSSAAGYEVELQEELPSGNAWQTTSTTAVTEARHRPAKLERGRYRWRVRAIGKDGSKGRWSDYRRLYMY